MTDTREPRSLIAAAEQAASAGDHAAAEQSLREAARLQEASGGPLHPDLANTLNNLGVVCEITGKTEDAEQFYRRAHAIASASLPADHPFVRTSAKNLRDFCEARGLPLERPGPLPTALPEATPPFETGAGPIEAPEVAAAGQRSAPPGVAVAKPSPSPAPLPPVSSTPATASPALRAAPGSVEPTTAPDLTQPPRATPGRALAVVVVLVVIGLGAYFWLSPDDSERPSPAAATAPAPSAPASQAVPRSTEPASVAPAPTPAAPLPDTTPPAAPIDTGTRTAAPAASAANVGSAAPRESSAPTGGDSRSPGAAPAIVEAQLCRSLSRTGAWRCEPAGSPVAPGPLFFYTRLSADRDTLVRHRWYRGDRLAQAVELRVRANPGSGYRTYSRNTVTAQAAGDWRVELTAEDGTVLREVRFVVR